MANLTPFNRKNNNVTNETPTNPFNMIDDFFDDAVRNFPFFRRNLRTDPFKVDVLEKDKEYLVDAELPGVKQEDVDVSINDEGRLTILVSREERTSTKSEENNYVHQERRFGSMKRSLFLANANPKNVNARLKDGLLSITVGKEGQTLDNQTHKIEIE